MVWGATPAGTDHVDQAVGFYLSAAVGLKGLTLRISHPVTSRSEPAANRATRTVA